MHTLRASLEMELFHEGTTKIRFLKMILEQKHDGDERWRG